ncbi:hypothetical protein JCM39194_08430 [Desulfotomaculum varum]
MTEIDVQLTCPDCDHTFSLQPENILEMDSITCPGCGCPLPEEELRYLKIAIDYMKERKTH